jgi:hypothetical protein
MTKALIINMLGLVVGVQTVSVRDVKPGVFRVHVVGGDACEVADVVRAHKSVGIGCVLVHQRGPDDTAVEILL